MVEFKIEGVAVTKNHLGCELEVIFSIDSQWLPLGHIGKIVLIDDQDGEIFMKDTGESVHSKYGLGFGTKSSEKIYNRVRWVDRTIVDGDEGEPVNLEAVKPKPSSAKKRKEIAYDIKVSYTQLLICQQDLQDAQKHLNDLIVEGESGGLTIGQQGDAELSVTFQPPIITYKQEY